MGEAPTLDARNVREMDLGKDLDQVENIWLKGAKDAHKSRIPETFWDSRRSAFVTEELPNAEERYVYEDEHGEVAGFITALSSGYMLEVYVKEDSRGKDIGRILFLTLAGENAKFPQLKGKYSRFRSSVYAHNSTSLAWHLRNGFGMCGVMFCPHTGLPKVEMLWERKT